MIGLASRSLVTGPRGVRDVVRLAGRVVGYGVGVPVHPDGPPGHGVGIDASLPVTLFKSALIVALVAWPGFQSGADGNSELFADDCAAISFSKVNSAKFGAASRCCTHACTVLKFQSSNAVLQPDGGHCDDFL